MKNRILTIAFLAGFGICAQAQSSPAKPVVKSTTVSKIQKKTTAAKPSDELKSMSNDNAFAPLMLPVPKLEADTTLMPVVRKDGY